LSSIARLAVQSFFMAIRIGLDSFASTPLGEIYNLNNPVGVTSGFKFRLPLFSEATNANI
jgi:hypothetical protein